MKLDPEILKIIVCPVCKGDLRLKGEELICTSCRRHYPVVDGIPYLLPEDLFEILKLDVGRSP